MRIEDLTSGMCSPYGCSSGKTLVSWLNRGPTHCAWVSGWAVGAVLDG